MYDIMHVSLSLSQKIYIYIYIYIFVAVLHQWGTEVPCMEKEGGGERQIY